MTYTGAKPRHRAAAADNENKKQKADGSAFDRSDTGRETSIMGRAFVKSGLGFIGAITVLGASAPSRAQDARALLEKTTQTYQKLGSYQGKGIVEISQAGGGLRQTLMATSSDMLYRRANKLFLKMESRSNNMQIFSDGGRLTIYKETAQTFTNGPTAPTLPAMLPLLQNRAGIGGMLDPLYFLSHARLPDGLANLKMQAPTKVNGHDVVVVTGIWQGLPPADLPPNPFCSRGARWTLYLDKSNALLQKVEARIPGKMRVPIKRDGKVTATLIPGEITMTHTIVDARPNAPIDDKLFVFTPPKGANEQKSIEDLIKSGK